MIVICIRQGQRRCETEVAWPSFPAGDLEIIMWHWSKGRDQVFPPHDEMNLICSSKPAASPNLVRFAVFLVVTVWEDSGHFARCGPDSICWVHSGYLDGQRDWGAVTAEPD
jgi:hypothetical protein